MSVATVASRALAGIDAPEVTVEVHLGPGLPAFHIVGLPDAEVREARDRVRAALNHAHFEFPARRMTVSGNKTAPNVARVAMATTHARMKFAWLLKNCPLASLAPATSSRGEKKKKKNGRSS